PQTHSLVLAARSQHSAIRGIGEDYQIVLVAWHGGPIFVAGHVPKPDGEITATVGHGLTIRRYQGKSALRVSGKNGELRGRSDIREADGSIQGGRCQGFAVAGETQGEMTAAVPLESCCFLARGNIPLP